MPFLPEIEDFPKLEVSFWLCEMCRNRHFQVKTEAKLCNYEAFIEFLESKKGGQG
jgi:hypothetical protein